MIVSPWARFQFLSLEKKPADATDANGAADAGSGAHISAGGEGSAIEASQGLAQEVGNGSEGNVGNQVFKISIDMNWIALRNNKSLSTINQ